MDAHDIEGTGALAPMSARQMNGAVQGPVALARLPDELRGALSAIGDMTGAAAPSRLVAAVDQALSAFGDLWHDYEIAQAATDTASICVVGELTSTWLMNRLIERVRTLECAISDDRDSGVGDVVASAMTATRWAARWCWLRYKQPSSRLWANAAYLYRISEHWQSQARHMLPRDVPLPAANTTREFARLLFAQWVSPISLPVGAQLLFEQLVHASDAQPTIAQTATSLEDAIFDAGSGRVLLRRQPISDASTRYIAFGPLREEICQRATQLALGNIEKAESAKQLLRSVIGRRTRTLIRLGGRFEMLRRVYVCVGYDMIANNSRMDGQQFAEGFVLDRGEEGCRIRFERLTAATNSLCVGALLQIRDVFEGEVCLGIVRWLKRIDPAGWEIGVWLIRGAIGARRMRKQRGVWPNGKLTENILLVDDDKRGSATSTLCILPRQSAFPGVKLIAEGDRFRCDVMTCIETGVNFDVSVVKIYEIQEPHLKLCSLNSQGNML